MSNTREKKAPRAATSEEVISPRRAFLLGTLAAVPAAALLGACSPDVVRSGDRDDEADKDEDVEDGEAPSDEEGKGPRVDAGKDRKDASTGTGRDAAASDPDQDPGSDEASGEETSDAGVSSQPDASTPSSGGDASTATDASAPSPGDAGMPSGGSNSCTVYPQQTQGPYYLDLKLMRNDIRDGKEGKPLKLVIQVLGANGCTPRPNTAVDIWHCDAAGVYSGYRGQLGGLDTREEDFLRGTLVTDRDGRVEFTTIYPGWYPGRTPHIHFKVHASARTSAISQIYFPDEISKAVYATAPYSKHTGSFTPLASDSVNRGGKVSPVTPVTQGDGFLINMTITVAG